MLICYGSDFRCFVFVFVMAMILISEKKMEQSKGGVWGSKFDGIRGGIVVTSGEL